MKRARTNGHLPTLPALDGIRAIAIAAVLLYHGEIAGMPAGFLGVEVFFVLSGYLITSLLWSELLSNNRIILLDFWRRRARRLLPALFLMLAAVAFTLVVWWPHEVGRSRGDILGALTYTSNWYSIHADHSYFATFARPSPFGHLWSLAIEEQFYLLWPPLLVFLWAWLKRRRKVVGALAAGALLSAGGMWLLYSGGDPSRVYYGTDTRASALLIGSALAIVWRPWARKRERLHTPTWILDIGFMAALGGVIWSFMRFDEFSSLTYRPGMQLTALATAALIAVSVHPNAVLPGILAWRPIRAIGKRSYSIYLWYWPVFVLTRPGVDLDVSFGVGFAIRMAITLVLAEASYRYVEVPIRNGALGRAWTRFRERAERSRQHRLRVAFGTGVAGFASIVVFTTVGMGLALAPGGNDGFSPQSISVASSVADGSDPNAAAHLVRVDETIVGVVETAPNLRVDVIGDSVMVGARAQLRSRIQGSFVDAAVGRQVDDGIGILRRLRAAGHLGRAVVIHLGTNGTFSAAQFDELMHTLASVPKVVLVSVKVPRRWEGGVNRTLAEGIARHPRAVLVNWHDQWRTCRGKVFGGDGTHLTAEGADCYSSMIAAAVA